jgi:NAD-dependent deacetylase
MDDLARLQFELTRPDAFPLVVTGAGVSLASGIPTFRGSDPDSVWSKDTLEKGTFRYFQKNPTGSWTWYLARFDAARTAKPNPAHHALVEMEKKLLARGCRFILCTQNVDGLHLMAGSQNVVEIHGAARKMRCETKNASCKYGAPNGFLDWDEEAFKAFRSNPCFETVPRCPACGNFLRAHVLWFDEGYSDHEDYGIDRLFEVEGQFTCVLYVGTSFAVTITDIIMNTAFQRDVPQFVVDPHRTGPEDVTYFTATAEEFLPNLVSKL